MRNSSVTERAAAVVAAPVAERDRDDPPMTNLIPPVSWEIEAFHPAPLSDEPVSDYLLLPPRTLRQACRDARRDQAGCNCP